MRTRCRNSRCKDYRHYGGRGIGICSRWDDFAAFLADMGSRPDRGTIERIDVDGNYEPGNCRWASQKEQTRNKRTNVRVTFDGQTLCVGEWAERMGLPSQRLWQRLFKLKWPIERALCAEKRR